MILTLARALVLWALAHQVQLVRAAACGNATPCADPDAANDAERIIRARFSRLPLFLRP